MTLKYSIFDIKTIFFGKCKHYDELFSCRDCSQVMIFGKSEKMSFFKPVNENFF